MRRVTVDDAVTVIRSGDTILVGGSGGGHAVPEAPMAAVERRFLAEGAPSACFTSTSARGFAASPRTDGRTAVP